MNHVYIIGPSSVKKIPLIYWITLICIIGHSSVKNSPYLLNEPHMHNRPLLCQKFPLFTG